MTMARAAGAWNVGTVGLSCRGVVGASARASLPATRCVSAGCPRVIDERAALRVQVPGCSSHPGECARTAGVPSPSPRPPASPARAALPLVNRAHHGASACSSFRIRRAALSPSCAPLNSHARTRSRFRALARDRRDALTRTQCGVAAHRRFAHVRRTSIGSRHIPSLVRAGAWLPL